MTKREGTGPLGAEEETAFGFRMTAVRAEARHADLLRDAEAERQAKEDQAAHARRMLELLIGLQLCQLMKVR